MNDSGAKSKSRIRIELPQASSAQPGDEKVAAIGIQAEPMFVGETCCRNHPGELARFLCSKCKRYFCGLCVSTRPFKGAPAHWCRSCGTVCNPVIAAPVEAEIVSFPKTLMSAFGYPFKGDGVFLTVTGTVFILLLDLLSWVASFAAFLSLFAVVVLSVLGGGYLFSFIKSVVQSSAQGRDVLPDWPDIADFAQEMIIPFFQCLIMLIFCFLPGLLLAAYGELKEATPIAVGGQVLTYCGLCYLPMALLTVSMFDSVGGINPALIVPSIARTIGHYLLVMVVFLVLLGIAAGLDFMFTELASIPILPSILDAFFTFYAVLVLARAIGLLYRVNEDSLGWFKARNRH